MRYGTVCSGVEAFGPAWEKLGYECAFHAEIAPHPAAVLRYHYPNVHNYGDFTTITSSPATRIDLLAGGTPCQDFSVAGLRRGLAGQRGNLTLEFARLAERLRPRWLVWENVPGVLSADGGRAFGQFLTLLAECGYYAAYRVLDAQHFGVPQRRRRVFVVGYLGDWRPAAAVLFERHSLRGDYAPRREEGQNIASALTTSPYADNESQESRLVVTAEGCAGLPSLTASNASKHANNQQPLCITGALTHTLTAEGHDASEDGTGRGTPIVTGTLCASGKAAGSATQQDVDSGLVIPVSFALRGREGGSMPEIHSDGQTAGTLRAGNGGSSRDYIAGSSVRRLTPRECERLMGYPDDWTRYGIKPNGTQYEVADGPRYQMCGNGWATDVANWVGARVQMVNALLLHQ